VGGVDNEHGVKFETHRPGLNISYAGQEERGDREDEHPLVAHPREADLEDAPDEVTALVAEFIRQT